MHGVPCRGETSYSDLQCLVRSTLASVSSRIWIHTRVEITSTAGLAENCRLGLRHGSGCRCRISIPRPVMKIRQKTTYRTLDKMLKNIFEIFY